MANSVDPDQTAPIGAVCSGSTLFASILNLSVMLGNYLQQTTSADDIFRCIFFLGVLRANKHTLSYYPHTFLVSVRDIVVTYVLPTVSVQVLYRYVSSPKPLEWIQQNLLSYLLKQVGHARPHFTTHPPRSPYVCLSPFVPYAIT